MNGRMYKLTSMAQVDFIPDRSFLWSQLKKRIVIFHRTSPYTIEINNGGQKIENDQDLRDFDLFMLLDQDPAIELVRLH